MEEDSGKRMRGRTRGRARGRTRGRARGRSKKQVKVNLNVLLVLNFWLIYFFNLSLYFFNVYPSWRYYFIVYIFQIGHWKWWRRYSSTSRRSSNRSCWNRIRRTWSSTNTAASFGATVWLGSWYITIGSSNFYNYQ